MQKKNISITNWTNENNLNFYEEISIPTMHEYAKNGGFDDCCDLKAIHNYLLGADSILDLGAGYGRAIEYLSKNFPNAKLTAVERSSKFCKHMHAKYQKLINIYQTDLNNFVPKNKFDVVLWLWANISDFSKHEHINVLTKIISWLAPQGRLFMDILLDEFRPKHINIEYPDNKNYVAVTNNLTVYGYTPTVDEIREYTKILKLNIVKEVPFVTTTNRNRLIFVIEKSSMFSC